MSERRHRNVAHFWTDKQVIRFFRKNFDTLHYKNLRSVYLALCEIDSDFGEGSEIRGFTETVATYSGMHKDTVRKYLKALKQCGLINYYQEMMNGKGFGHSKLEMYVWENNEEEVEWKLDILNQELEANEPPLENTIDGKSSYRENQSTVEPVNSRTSPYKNNTKVLISKNKNPAIAGASSVPSIEGKSKKTTRVEMCYKSLTENLPMSFQNDLELLELLKDYLNLRKEKRDTIEPTWVKYFLREIKEVKPSTLKVSLKKSLSKGWTGIFPNDLKQEDYEKYNGSPKSIIRPATREEYERSRRQ